MIMADLQKLERFSRLKERDITLFFQGRDDLLKDIDYACREAVENIKAGEKTTSETRLFYGAPGAGKTSLLREIEKRCQQNVGRTSAPIVVNLPSCQSLNKEEEVVLYIAQAIEKDTMFRTTTHSDTEMSASVFALLKGIARRGQVRNPPDATFFNLGAMYNDSALQRPIILCVDEIQGIGPDAKAMLSLLHQGNHGLPIIPIYAGLGHSLQVLMEHEISRPVSGYIHSVGALAKEEACAAVKAMFTAFQVECSGAPYDWPTILAERADCWPQHLHNGMRALARELARPEVNGVLRNVSIETIFTTEQAFRDEAYGWRISDTLRKTKKLVAQVMQHVTARPYDLEKVEALVLLLNKKSPSDPVLRSSSLPKDMDVSDYVNHMVHRGLLQEFINSEKKVVLRCPIPSLATYVMNLGGVDPTHEPLIIKR